MKIVLRLLFCLAIGAPWLAADPPSHEPDSGNALLHAVMANDLSAAEDALTKGASVDFRNHQGRTGLILAAQAGALDMAKLLVEKGADVNARTPTEVGSTVLCFAVEGKNPALVAFLLEQGADVNGRSRNGQTALHYAAAHGLDESVQQLLSAGANPLATVIVQDQFTHHKLPYDAADFAQKNGRWKTLILILKAQEQALRALLLSQWDIYS